ncbi:hypothetical protein [Dactylosporangium salmoneum]|uniref:Uncharacterized protein n=1 Tax=Dactylosporangium salmoneum TaxID=53361 RepID=A0ABN3GBD1_9ACTN
MSLPPHAVAGIDQDLADLDSKLDFMIRRFREASAERGETQTLADLAVTANATFEPEILGELLAAAVRRLAIGDAR